MNNGSSVLHLNLLIVIIKGAMKDWEAQHPAMVNEEKVKLMTKLAVFEKKHGSDEIKMGKYYRHDYLGLKLIGTIFSATIGFVLIYSIYLIMNSDAFIKSLTSLDLIGFLMSILLAYACFLAAFLVLTYLLYSYRFRKGRERLKQYNIELKQLIRLLKKEKKEKMELQWSANRSRYEPDEDEEDEDDYNIISY